MCRGDNYLECLVLVAHVSDNDSNTNAITAQNRVGALIFRNFSRALVVS